jgi:hypothetical protein
MVEKKGKQACIEDDRKGTIEQIYHNFFSGELTQSREN